MTFRRAGASVCLMMDLSLTLEVARSVEVPEGLDAFCRREHPRLVGALSLYCGDPSVAEELAQEALERACERWSQVRSMESPGAWLHRVALNLAHSRFRRRAAERRAHARNMATAQHHEDDDVASSVALRREVSALPERQKAVIVLRYYIGFDVAQTARLLDLTPSAVKASTHRAVSRLRGQLAFEPEEEVTDER